MDFSIVPKMIHSKGIVFTDEGDIQVSVCEESIENYIYPFEKPFLTIDTFAKKTVEDEELVNINFDELKKYGYIVVKIKATISKKWRSRQGVIYFLEKTSNPIPVGKKVQKIPGFHIVQKDRRNNRIRLVGINAGYPHYSGKFGGNGPWCDIMEK